MVQRRAGTPASAVTRLLVLLFSISLIAAACGGDDDDSSGGDTGGGANNTTVTDDSKPVAGGSITYGLEADPGHSVWSGRCRPDIGARHGGSPASQVVPSAARKARQRRTFNEIGTLFERRKCGGESG